jgi:hypothetical protein
VCEPPFFVIATISGGVASRQEDENRRDRKRSTRA